MTADLVKRQIGERITFERLRLRLSKSSCAKLGGIQRLAQHNYESGVRAPSACYLHALASHGMDVSYVLTGSRAHDCLSNEKRETGTDDSIFITWDTSDLRKASEKIRTGLKALHSSSLKRAAARWGLADPCPFCGSIDAETQEVDTRTWAVCCYRCGATGPHSETSPHHAISKWNMVKQ